MPTVAWNKETWDKDWGDQGEGWSQFWGRSDTQWNRAIFPRVQRHLPTGTVLEIACGHGRWTRHLAQHCDRLIGVDLAEFAIEHCKKRFAGDPRLTFHTNNGIDLSFVNDRSVDFVFSYDSLVHVEPAIIEGYLSQFRRILKPGAFAFLHHSNLGSSPKQGMLLYTPIIRRAFSIAGLIERTHHNREPRVSANVVADLARKHGLSVVSQECVTWGTKRLLLDCMTTLRLGPAEERGVVLNRHFMGEAASWLACDRLYQPM